MKAIVPTPAAGRFRLGDCTRPAPGVAEPDADASYVAHAIARAARAGGAKRSSGPQQPDARVSLSAQLGLVPAPAVNCSCLERKREDERRDAHQRPAELGQPR